MTAASAVNQFLPGYRLTAPESLSYYSVTVCTSSSPAWTGPDRPGPALSPAVTHPDPPHPPSVCGGLPPQVSETFLSSCCQSLSSLTRLLIPCPLTAPLPPTLVLSLSGLGGARRQSRLFSFSLVSSGARYLSADPRACMLSISLSHTHTLLSSSILLSVLQV